ncbi:MAG TPA: hypothetical protein PLE24_09440 [Chitinispirillaceae bacterium]|jgi:hypothetical protein|nr:hypothetical protein [Chitinispirillaceae bacterium]
MRYFKRLICIFIPIIGFALNACANSADNDLLLFSISLNDDTTSIYGCHWDDRIKTNLSGPVLMEKGTLLFYSQKGYVLYNQNGKLIDSHSLFKINKNNKNPYFLAYPLDSITILYYRAGNDGKPEVYEKRLFKSTLKKISSDKYTIYSEIDKSVLFNIACNSITDEMSTKSFLMPHLLGYTSLKGGLKWWSIDRLYSFTSPIIVEKDGKYSSFFPGLKADQAGGIKTHLIEPLGVFTVDKRFFYYGLVSSKGNTEEEYYQAIILCDQAGNILSVDRLLKQETADAVLAFNKEQNTNYTVRRAGKMAFVPAVDRRGFLYYGVMNYEWKKLDVFMRQHLHYVPVKTENNAESKFINEGNIAFSPIKLECNSLANRGIRPEVILLSGKDVNFLDNEQTTRKGYFVTVHRYTDETLRTKLSRTQSALPAELQKMQDSIAGVNTSWCPYTISLNQGEKGEIARLFYGFGDVIMCARVVEVTNTNEVFVRVDLDNWAEMIVFSTEGKYLSRFIFNRQHYEKRKDLVVISEKREIVERDFESDRNGKAYFRWELQ